MFDFQEELRKLPDQPGVYIMHDKTDAIIYIGKAVSLRKRVRQYFQPSHDEGIKKKQMVEHIARFEYIITDSELEALVLECNLIKEHTPKYNTMLRDDKTYPYIRVTVQEDFPRVLFSRQVKKDKSCVMGMPVKDTIKIADTDGFIKETPKRSLVWQIQTPQCFVTAEIREAYQKMMEAGDDSVTDDGMVMETYGIRGVRMIKGSYENMKITTPEDMLLGEAILKGRSTER